MIGTCQRCGSATRVGGRGRPQKFCSSACRQAAYRARTLPTELTGRDRWVRWKPVRRKDRVTKMPVAAWNGRAASSTDPATWTTYDAARKSAHGVGLGFVLGDGVGCIDLDHVLDAKGRPNRVAAEFVASLPATYTEVSPSGDGLHLWFLMPEGPGSVRTVDGVSVETYSAGRYITVTGKRFGDCPSVLASL